MTTQIDLLRHGEPEGGPKYRGSLDDPLNDLGWRQMRTSLQGHPTWDSIVTSPLRRCSHFAHKLGEECKIPVVIEKKFQEMHFGQWEGRTSEEILKDPSQHLTLFWRDPLNNPPPDGEHLRDFHKRIGEAWYHLLEQTQDQSILVVAHGGVIRMILSLILGTPLYHLSRYVVDYASVTRIRVDQVEGVQIPRLISHGGTFIS